MLTKWGCTLVFKLGILSNSYMIGNTINTCAILAILLIPKLTSSIVSRCLLLQVFHRFPRRHGNSQCFGQGTPTSEAVEESEFVGTVEVDERVSGGDSINLWPLALEGKIAREKLESTYITYHWHSGGNANCWKHNQHNLSHVLDVFSHRPDWHLHILPRPWWDRLNSVAHGSSMLGQLDDHTIRPPRWWALLARYASIQMWYTICLAICTHRTERYAMQECNGLRGICLRTPKLANFKLPLNHKSPHCDKPHNSI